MLNRVITLIAGVAIAYSIIYFGDGLYVSMLETKTTPQIPSESGVLLGVVVGILPAIWGLYSWREAMSSLNGESRSISTTLKALSALVFLSCFFGIVAGPFANYGPYPLSWASRWIWILLLAFVPSLLVGADLISEAISKIKNKNETSEKDNKDSGLNFMRKVRNA